MLQEWCPSRHLLSEMMAAALTSAADVRSRTRAARELPWSLTLKDNSRGWGRSQVDRATIGGLTPRRVLARDKQSSLSGGLAMGKNYYQGLWSQFGDLSATYEAVARQAQR